MNTRNLLIIAAVPGFRANTKLEREDNNAPRVKVQPLDIYADLKVAPKSLSQQLKESVPLRSSPSNLEQIFQRLPVKVRDLDLKQRRNYEDTLEQYFREHLNNPNVSGQPGDLPVDLKNKTVFYKGRWWTEYEASALSSIERNRLADAYQKAMVPQPFYMDQPKPRKKPGDKL